MHAYLLMVDWEDEARRALDPESPFCFGPYDTVEDANREKDRILKRNEDDTHPDRLLCTIRPLMRPSVLPGFLSP
ncbi:hypothetical protein KJZ71_01010 [Patescibacteria group bacterium]|uniref:Uncharacterized protein n=1 Tax=candidate division WWE3 bacterium TaxID=2053526 RepID=A0A928TU62_UNCKA|nr:hypothetical protein [candidate division WWE3 bacterium]MCL4732366.1 hypothetical protein [Patescibacteria group bacterium]MDL1952791.1 hypothetical protein [Candidatus Uhrbacteria bacterium UHB]RIL01027.1 MAG: hypothetical protein DCC77_00600 [Candidatus Uhrbacteria bacterium]